jgi:SAM-dependent methyltransferase
MKLRLLRALEASCKYIARSWQRRLPQRGMDQKDEEFLQEHLDFSHMAAADNVKMMSRFTAKSREEFALKTKSLVLYTPDEAAIIKNLEEMAALRAAPQGYELKVLNGINIGCGNRRINEYLVPIDIMRENLEDQASGAHHAFLKEAILANPDDLPFKQESLDYIVALHMLEHISNPMEILRYWGTMLKPGGGIGLILPNYEYTWNAVGDHSQFGHKWNTNAAIFRRLYERHLEDHFELEEIGTLPHKISFDVVLRKPGIFQSFAISNTTSKYSGAELARMGTMVSEFGG